MYNKTLNVWSLGKLVTQAVSLGLVFGFLSFFFLRSVTNRPLVSTAHALLLIHAYGT